MLPVLYSLLIAVCAPNTVELNKKNCEYIYHSGGYTAQECTQAQFRLLARWQGKGITSLRLAQCEEEDAQQPD